jgi:hypothetical protein
MSSEFVSAATTNTKLAHVVKWFQDGVTVVAEDYRGNVTSGLIEVEPISGSGVWGYGGDSIAVRVNGVAWPSAKVRPSNLIAN